MRKIAVYMNTGYCGEEVVEVVEVNGTETEEKLEELVWQMAVDHAAAYGHEMCSDDCENEECEHEHPGSTNIEGWYEDYAPEIHDQLI